MSEPVTQKEEERYAELQKLALDFARENRSGDLQKMIEAGMPVSLSDEKGQTLLMLASYNGHMETTRVLLEQGAEVDRKNDRGQTPLGGAAFKGFTEIANLLIESGADVNADNGGGMRPVHYAAMFGRFEMVDLLEKKGAALHSAGHGKRKWLPLFARLVGKVRSFFR